MANPKSSPGDSSLSDQQSDIYLPLQMAVDKKTEMYVKFAKVMIIFQGPYTPQRTSAINNIEVKFKYASCILSDETYIKQRKTACIAEQTEEYHDYFKQESKAALETGNNLLVIDSTLSNLNQNRYYIALAQKMQYIVLVIPPVVTGSVSDNWPSKSQAHSFRKLGTIIKSSTMFQHQFAAWYLHDMDSYELRHEAGLYVQDCIEGIPEFAEFVSKVCIPNEKSVGKEIEEESSDTSLTETFIRFFNLEESRQDLAYCVTKIFNGNLLSITEYFKKDCVRNNYGKMSKLFIAGFIVSPYMIAARVKLTFHQKDLWDMEDELDESSKVPLWCPSDLLSDSIKELPEVDIALISSKSNQTMVGTNRTIHEPLENIYKSAKGRGCHVVLGKSPTASSRNIDYDVQFALRRENRAEKTNADLQIEDLERCVVKRIGKFWYIYLKEMFTIDALFASCLKPFAYENAFK